MDNEEFEPMETEVPAADEEEEKRRKPWLILIGAVLVIGIAAVLVTGQFDPKAGAVSAEPEAKSPLGTFSVGGKREAPVVEVVEEEVPMISFTGYGKYEVSKDYPDVEFSNPEGNDVDMVFTLTDKATGDMIARTDRVGSGQFVYVNVVDYYSEPGVYDMAINISTFAAGTDTPMNGLNQEMEITVK